MHGACFDFGFLPLCSMVQPHSHTCCTPSSLLLASALFGLGTVFGLCGLLPFSSIEFFLVHSHHTEKPKHRCVPVHFVPTVLLGGAFSSPVVALFCATVLLVFPLSSVCSHVCLHCWVGNHHTTAQFCTLPIELHTKVYTLAGTFKSQVWQVCRTC